MSGLGSRANAGEDRPENKGSEFQRRSLLTTFGLMGGGGAAGAFAMRVPSPRASPAQSLAPEAQIITARSLGAAGDGTGDDGAVLTAAIRSLVGTLATHQSTTPLCIDFGDGRFVYNLQTPIVVQQNHVRLRGEGAILQCNSAHAIVGDHASSANILFGVGIHGFTLKGRIAGDAIVIKSGSQCNVTDIRNYASIAGSIVAFLSVLSSRTRAIKSDGEFGATCRSILREDVYEKTPGHFFNCIANRHEDLLGYGCSGAAVHLNESDAFVIEGDFENCDGPAADLLNSRFGTISIYTEVNGQRASNAGSDTADDIRIRSAPGKLISRSSNIIISQTMCGGAQVQGRTPNNVHIVSGDECLIVNSFVGGNIAIEAGSRRNRVGLQGRFSGKLIDRGQQTISIEEPSVR
jgi:hypothetical protein